MKLSIHSLTQTLFSGEASQLTLPTELGEITILNNHRALIALVKKGFATVIDAADQEKRIEIPGGFLEVKPGNNVTVLVG